MTTYKQIIYDGGDKVLVDMAKKAQKLNTARSINVTDADGTHTGTAASFDGSGDVNIKLPATISADITGNAQTATSATSAGHQTTADSATSAGHATSADSATTATSATSAGTAASASEAAKLSTARSIKTDLGSTSAASFDGSANVTPGVTGVLPIANGGTGHTDGTAVLQPEGSILGGINMPSWGYTYISIGGSAGYVLFNMAQGADRNNKQGFQTLYTANGAELRFSYDKNGVNTYIIIATL